MAADTKISEGILGKEKGVSSTKVILFFTLKGNMRFPNLGF